MQILICTIKILQLNIDTLKERELVEDKFESDRNRNSRIKVPATEKA